MTPSGNQQAVGSWQFAARFFAYCLLLAAFCLLPVVSWSDEIEVRQAQSETQLSGSTLSALSSQLLVIQARMDAERARYDAARAQIERAAVVFRELKRAEKELKEKIQGAAGRGQQAERKPSSTDK